VEYRDQDSAVIANDGTLSPGKMVIVLGTYQGSGAFCAQHPTGRSGKRVLTPFFSERSIGLCDRALSEPEAAPGEAAVPVLQDESAGELCAVQDDF
jgi:hypothetical protein